MTYYNMTSFFRFANKQAINQMTKFLLAHARYTFKPGDKNHKIIFFTQLLTFQTSIFTENNQHIQN
jgi:hypothetical protein